VLGRGEARGPRGYTVKDRLPHHPARGTTWNPDCGFVDQVLRRCALPGPDRLALGPTLVSRYRRSTLFLPATKLPGDDRHGPQLA